MSEQRRLSFGGVASLYDRARPSYPDALVDDVIELAAAPATALEVGAGTGKATGLFAARGVSVHALEPSPEMIAVARQNHPLVSFEQTEFEAWVSDGRTYPLLYSAQAWHWIDAGRRYPLARGALSDGGVLAAFWNRPAWDENPLRAPLDEVYRREAPDLAADGPMQPRCGIGAAVWGRWSDEVAAADGFGDPSVRRYEWVASYATAEYVDLLRTHSDHIVIDPAQRERLLRGVAQVIDQAGGVVEITYITRLCLARAA